MNIIKCTPDEGERADKFKCIKAIRRYPYVATIMRPDIVYITSQSAN